VRLGAEGGAHADFAGPLCDTERQDAEQPDAGYEQREQAEPGEEHCVQ
jgi:hypothetical protein